jgi:predicted  nucleic acid-binding Zn-ribbon protein
MSDSKLEQLVESNARAIQAMLDSRAEERLEFQAGMDRMQAGMDQLREVVVRLTTMQEGMTRMLVALDEERPTILRKLNSIENKLDQVLELRTE